VRSDGVWERGGISRAGIRVESAKVGFDRGIDLERELPDLVEDSGEIIGDGTVLCR
jgi:hypothetical protein